MAIGDHSIKDVLVPGLIGRPPGFLPRPWPLSAQSICYSAASFLEVDMGRSGDPNGLSPHVN
eukprot:4958692-Amphidinium_carterae.1